MAWITNPEIWFGLLTLTTLEIILGIDNIIFISILAGKLPDYQQARARRLGLSFALITRVGLLLSITWVIGLVEPLFTLFEQQVTGRDLILVCGGVFLLAKSTREIHDKLEGAEGHASAKVAPSFVSVIIQILLLDIIFSLDSVITAVGMVRQLGVMIASVVIAVVFMLAVAEGISSFVNRHPTIKILALSFLLLIGMTLIIEGMHQHIPKGYIYFAMGFAVFVEILNMRLRAPKETVPIKLRSPYSDE